MSVAEVLGRLCVNIARMNFTSFLLWSFAVFMLYGAIGAGVFRIMEGLLGLEHKLYWWDLANALACTALWLAGFYFYPKYI